MAPEILSPMSELTFETDVFAFGRVCLELYSGMPPYTEFRHDMQVVAALHDCIRPANPGPGRYGRHLSQELWAWILQCWNQEPAQRPTAS
ncbi:hypothetical protein JAAARDRAFT_505235 [Jaapia argillacea MUCL 33604]|uniref:Protein kinase domain-containing protein n=1 Tax=Jaapia argillacea MUCL 33604 TaxID=933084 RepID=A0A067PMN4_9AGAM|nr:hypothetical protein JAAARDRAFT_505235 [Jaapia argillacea MUCL 33604]